MLTFHVWLSEQPYRSTTARQTYARVRFAAEQWRTTGAIPKSAVEACRRYALYLAEHPPAKASAFERWVLEHVEPTRAMKPRSGPRKLQAQRIPEHEWSRLVGHLEQDRKSREATVLMVMVATGHRIGDVLRITRRELDAAKRSGTLKLEVKGGHELQVPLGGAPEVWDRLSRTFRGGPDDTVALWVSEGSSADPEAGGAAYKRCSRYLGRVGKQLRLSGRVHLHRLRRTVAVKALGISRDVHAVQQLLGHRSLASTLRYVDELRKEDVEKLQRQLRGGS